MLAVMGFKDGNITRTESPKILIVEDNSDDEVLLIRQLKKAKLHRHVRCAYNGKQALEYLKDSSDGLSTVFLDLKLPKLSGLEVLEAIRKDPRTFDLAVIVMTSSTSPEELEECRRLGVVSFIQKPLTLTSFVKAFADTFHSRRCQATSEVC